MKIFIKTFGCRVNQVESEAFTEQFIAVGFEIVKDFETADVCVLNTCTVTGEADKDVEKMLRLIAARNPSCRLFATGCYATVHQEKVLKYAPFAHIVENPEKATLAALVAPQVCTNTDFAVSGHQGHSRAFVKVQDGCTGKCKYCLVRFARPVKSSKPFPVALAEVRALAKKGFAEIVLTGINIGNYQCPETGRSLSELVEGLLEQGEGFRIRLSSIEVHNITDALLAAGEKYAGRLCAHFHIPLQSGSKKVLAEMGREYTPEFYLSRMNAIKNVFPDAGIYADVIAGYPTETEADFEEGYNFIESSGFAGLHVFSYSPRPGTEAFAIPCLDRKIIKERAERLRALDRKLRVRFANFLVGTVQEVLVEEGKNGQVSAVAGNFQRVLSAAHLVKGSLVKLQIETARDGLCYGGLLPETGKKG